MFSCRSSHLAGLGHGRGGHRPSHSSGAVLKNGEAGPTAIPIGSSGDLFAIFRGSLSLERACAIVMA